VARQDRAHAWRARLGRPAWQCCHATACGAAKAGCRATPPGAAKGVTRCKKSLPGVVFKNKLKKVKIKKLPVMFGAFISRIKRKL
jgi:hypothetical protein